MVIFFRIDDKSVSRKHITISVSTVKPGSGSLVHTRSGITLEDEKTKFGTEIDGHRVASGASSLLKNDAHTFKLGKNSHTFHSKEIKSGKDPLVALRIRLEDTDIKVINAYVLGSTTHVVHSKRNTPKGLQALINAKYIVADSFVDALIYATTPTDLDQDESLSPLEEDYDGNWPDEMQHVPPKGKEPNERPVEKFAPNPERSTVFEGYTVVFCEKNQFDSLQSTINNGGGKALYFELRSGKTTTDELVGYIKNAAGEKGLGDLQGGSEGKGVVVVKFRGPHKDDFDWAADLGRDASLALDLRFVEQNEFMDAILMNDASVLRRPLEPLDNNDEPDSINRATTQHDTRQAVQESQPEPSQPPAPPRRQRGLIKSRFKGFSSDEDDDQPSLSSVPMASQPRPSQPAYQHSDSASETPINPRKRPAPDPSEEDNTDFVDQLLPAATAMKRRRLEAVESARQRGESPPTTPSLNPSPPPTSKAAAKKAKEPIDVKASLRSRREAADAAIAHDEETRRQDQDLTVAAIESMRDLAVIEEFDLLPRAHHKQHPNGNSSTTANGNTRWDPAWNGRKNFKKFRPHGSGGEASGAPRRRGVGQTLIVPLQEVKKKDFGIGQEYWLESGETLKRKRKEKERAGQSQSQSQSQFAVEGGGESESLGNERVRVKREGGGRQSVPKELVVEDDEEMPDTVDVEAPRRTRGMDTQSQASSSVAGTKGKTAGSGKAKPAVFTVKDDDSDSEDELKFRFGKRRRMG
ncbi:MAG: hypothetical protein Q9184_002625 [Pyrenodesmia sp. 2 TL-2023]